MKKFTQVFFKILEGIIPFCGTTDTPALDFWWCLLWDSKPEQEALFALGRGMCVTHSLSLTSGVIPAYVLTANVAAELFFSKYLQAGISGGQNQNLSCHQTGRWALYRLSYADLVKLSTDGLNLGLAIQIYLVMWLLADSSWCPNRPLTIINGTKSPVKGSLALLSSASMAQW